MRLGLYDTQNLNFSKIGNKLSDILKNCIYLVEHLLKGLYLC